MVVSIAGSHPAHQQPAYYTQARLLPRGETQSLSRRRASFRRDGGGLGLGGRRPFQIVNEPTVPAGEIESPDIDYGTRIHTTPAAKTSKPAVANVSPAPVEILPATAGGLPLPAEALRFLAKGSPTLARGSPALTATLRRPAKRSPVLAGGWPLLAEALLLLAKGSPTLARGSPALAATLRRPAKRSPLLARGSSREAAAVVAEGDAVSVTKRDEIRIHCKRDPAAPLREEGCRVSGSLTI
jgi:hypothetical protein